MFVVQRSNRLCSTVIRFARMSSGNLGDGAGKGGGGGGSIREAGGSFGRMEAAREEEYFYKKQKEQLNKLKSEQIHQKDFHEQQIREHEEAIRRHKE
ncbi:ATPase inhibitor mai-2, mitochondrial isoform X2 [Condylostylus longicornis]|nr:ATPase inhibitor mai-2, mitochondrial isoform X2 [Condylostylus longicornis]